MLTEKQKETNFPTAHSTQNEVFHAIDQGGNKRMYFYPAESDEDREFVQDTINKIGFDDDELAEYGIVRFLPTLIHVSTPRPIIGYQLYVDGSLEHEVHETHEVIERNVQSIKTITGDAMETYPNAKLEMVPVREGEVENPTFI